MKKIDFLQGGSFLSFLLQGEASLEEKKTLFQLLDPIFYQVIFQELFELFSAVVLGASLVPS